MQYQHYNDIANIFKFPDQNYPEAVTTCQQFMSDHYPEAADILLPFTEFVTKADYPQIEKLFIRTFDVQPLCCLDVGYILFGEDYKRGKLMSNLNRELNEAGLDNENELADHLPNVLKLIPGLTDTETREELVGYILLPALEKMVASFQTAKIKKKEKIYRKYHKTILNKSDHYALIYKKPLQALHKVLVTDFPDVPVFEDSVQTDFVKSVQTEMRNEESEK